MTITMPARELDRLGDSGLSTADLANVDDDVQGRVVYDRLGEEIGTVDDLLVSRQLLEAPFAIVRWGGILGLGRQERLVPMAIVTVQPNALVVERDREAVQTAPSLREELEGDDAEAYYAAVSDHYGVDPYWTRVSNR
jgi:PRC-barrel domain